MTRCEFTWTSLRATHLEGTSVKITEVKVFPVNEERLKAYVTITLDAAFVVRDLKIIKGNEGLFVAMPSKKRKDGQFKDIAHPLNQETRAEIERAVFDAYEAQVRSMGDDLADLRRDLRPVGEPVTEDY